MKRVQPLDRKLKIAIQNLQDGNNNTNISPLNIILSASICSRLFNIPFELLKLPFKRVSNKSVIRYPILILNLLYQGECARVTLYHSLHLFNTANDIIQQYIDHGYIESFTVIIPKNVYGTYYKGEAQHIRLTAKGYDLADHISKLLIDPRFLP